MTFTRNWLLLPIFIFFIASSTVQANNIQIANASLTGNTGSHAFVQFDLGWDNSWRGGGVLNWDAAWVFVKYRLSTGVWQHAYLNNSGHVASAGSQIDLGLLDPALAYNSSTNPVVGTFIYRDAAGTGNVSWLGTQLRWDYGALGFAYNDITDVMVLAVEMVYVPQGAFAAGSGGTGTFEFTKTTINTANVLTAPTGTGSLGGQAGGYPTGQQPPNAQWPNGYNAFYCMKYEMSQQAYVDFLNTLTIAQQTNRAGSAVGSPGQGAFVPAGTQRQGVTIQTPGVPGSTPAVFACNLDNAPPYGEPEDGKDIAMNFINWDDLSAFLDWCALRPISELEFEKAARGPLPPVADEYIWGTTSAAGSAYTLSNSGYNNEGIATNYNTTLGNANYTSTSGTINGPVRVGIYAANASNTGRVTAGASYYGIMELGGNVTDKAIGLGNPTSDAYVPNHGDGVLDAAGNNDVSGWTNYQGTITRGSYWQGTSDLMRTSDRGEAVIPGNGRSGATGGRGVRTAP